MLLLYIVLQSVDLERQKKVCAPVDHRRRRRQPTEWATYFSSVTAPCSPRPSRDDILL